MDDPNNPFIKAKESSYIEHSINAYKNFLIRKQMGMTPRQIIEEARRNAPPGCNPYRNPFDDRPTHEEMCKQDKGTDGEKELAKEPSSIPMDESMDEGEKDATSAQGLDISSERDDSTAPAGSQNASTTEPTPAPEK